MARIPNLTNDQLEQLIELFHEEPCLWDVNDTDYLSVCSRTAALNCIGGIMTLLSGESNANNADMYDCALKAMVSDWRVKWHEKSPEMDSEFPFGEVQLAPWRNEDIVAGFPDVRWAQTSGYGYTPNDNFERIFMAVAIDLPDFESPYDAVAKRVNGFLVVRDECSIHPRYKRQIADRLALAGFVVAYGLSDIGIYQGPLPHKYTVQTSTVRLDYDIALAIRAYEIWSGFELCCSTLNEDPTCGSQSAWTVTDLSGWSSTYIDLNNVCADGERPNVVGFRYLWRESPCALEACAVYSVENSLPAPPYRAFFSSAADKGKIRL